MIGKSLLKFNNAGSNEDTYVSAYIHVPFCKQKCLYCDFNSFAAYENHMDSYFDALQTEIILTGAAIDKAISNDKNEDFQEDLNENNEKLPTQSSLGYKAAKSCYKNLKTIFIGGGTPSYVPPEHISKTLKILEDTFGLAPGCEITIECNPGTLDKIKIESYHKAGINRISLGLQSTSDRILNNIGRIHTLKDFEKSLNLVREAGFDNINIDLIAGLPGQTVEDFTDTIRRVISYNPSHISIYSLILEPGTPFYEHYHDKTEYLPSDDDERKMYWTGVDLLKSNGYNQYEISNFAKPGFECRHNILCWETNEYFGFGAGAHSYIGDYRYSNECDIEKYIHKIELHPENTEVKFDKNESYKIFPAISEKTFLTMEEKEKEFFLLGFRMTKELTEERFYNLFKSDMNKYSPILEKLVNKGYIRKSRNGYKLTDYGIDFANQIFIEFV